MATKAQIEANRRNAQKSTVPEDRGRQGDGQAQRPDARRAGQGRRAGAAPGGPQGLDAKIRRWVEDLQPGGDAERDLVARAARISWLLDRAERCETAGLAVRVRRPSSRRTWRPSRRSATWAGSCSTTRGRGSCPSPGPPGTTTRPPSSAGSSPPPRAAAGCWSGGRSSATCSSVRPSGRSAICTGRSAFRAAPGRHDQRSGPQPPVQAWEMMSPGAAVDFWGRCSARRARVDPGFRGSSSGREIADKPADEDEGRQRMIAGRIERLEERVEVTRRSRGRRRSTWRTPRRWTPGPVRSGCGGSRRRECGS